MGGGDGEIENRESIERISRSRSGKSQIPGTAAGARTHQRPVIIGGGKVQDVGRPR